MFMKQISGFVSCLQIRKDKYVLSLLSNFENQATFAFLEASRIKQG